MAQMTFKDYGFLYNSAGEQVAKLPVFSYSADLSSFSASESIVLYIQGINPLDYNTVSTGALQKHIPTTAESTGAITFDDVISTKIFPALAIGTIEGVGARGRENVDFVFRSETSGYYMGISAGGSANYPAAGGCAFFYNEFYGSYTFGGIGSDSNGWYTAIEPKQYTNSLYKVPRIILESDPQDISIRCPDSVRQGLFIIVACDSSDEKYIDFTCTMSGHTSPMTKLMQNTDKTLRLQCGSDEGASELLLEVESGGATASKAIKVIPYTPGSPGSGDNEYDTTSRVTDISLLAFPDTVAPGGYSIILISVNGEGNYSQRITAEISGHTSAETQYFSDGYFCNIAVGKDETAESILVTITSAQDPSVSASVAINVDHSGDTPIDPGTDEERLQRAFWKGFAAGIPG